MNEGQHAIKSPGDACPDCNVPLQEDFMRKPFALAPGVPGAAGVGLQPIMGLARLPILRCPVCRDYWPTQKSLEELNAAIVQAARQGTQQITATLNEMQAHHLRVKAMWQAAWFLNGCAVTQLIGVGLLNAWFGAGNVARIWAGAWGLLAGLWCHRTFTSTTPIDWIVAKLIARECRRVHGGPVMGKNGETHA